MYKLQSPVYLASVMRVQLPVPTSRKTVEVELHDGTFGYQTCEDVISWDLMRRLYRKDVQTRLCSDDDSTLIMPACQGAPT